MLSQYLVNRLIMFDKLIKTNYVLGIKSLKYFNTGNKSMTRIPRNLKDCSRFLPKKKSIAPDDTEPIAETDESFVFYEIKPPPLEPFSPTNIKPWLEYNRKIFKIKAQIVDPEKLDRLGINLMAANFVIEWKGKIKFKNSDWLEGTLDKPVLLPRTFNPDYVIVALDLSNTEIVYEGLENMSPLPNLEWLSFKGCKYIDDWCLDKISASYPSLKYLDISDCKNVTERGLEALYKLLNLKTLITTNHNKSAAFELTCFMLEDCIPDLKCKIFNSLYAEKCKEMEDKKKECE